MRADHEENELHVDTMYEGLHKRLNDLDAKVTNFIHIVTGGQAEVGEEPSTSRLHADSATSVRDDPLKEEKETTFTLSPV